MKNNYYDLGALLTTTDTIYIDTKSIADFINNCIDTHDRFLLRRIENCCKYKPDCYLSIIINCIINKKEQLTDYFFDNCIAILTAYNKTEYTLICIKAISGREKEEFIL